MSEQSDLRKLQVHSSKILNLIVKNENRMLEDEIIFLDNKVSVMKNLISEIEWILKEEAKMDSVWDE